MRFGWCLDMSKRRRCARGIRQKFHLEVARRVLGIQLLENGQFMMLPGSYRKRLFAYVGLDLLFGEMGDAAAFEALPTNLTIDDAVREFALQHPEILELSKAFLRDGHSPWLPSELCSQALQPEKEEKSPKSPVSKLVSNQLIREPGILKKSVKENPTTIRTRMTSFRAPGDRSSRSRPWLWEYCCLNS